jgi:hypothetical protein
MANKHPARFYILDEFDAGKFAGREGVSMGWTTRVYDIGPVIGNTGPGERHASHR